MTTVKTEIVKVQRPIATNDPRSMWLIYGKGRKKRQQIQQSLVQNHVVAAMKGDFKAYFNAVWNDVSGWHIKDRLKDKEW